jgi:hypothetical protein
MRRQRAQSAVDAAVSDWLEVPRRSNYNERLSFGAVCDRFIAASSAAQYGQPVHRVVPPAGGSVVACTPGCPQ